MHTVDGSAGGGQLLRSAVALAALTGTAVRVENVRGARPEPGLKSQHVAAVTAAAEVASADTDGVVVGSETVTFDPGPVSGGTYEVAVGTAGSVTLVFETALPLAFAADEPIRLRATGGTDVAWSPPLEYHTRVKLPLLRAFGLVAAVDLERRGFYPAGGGAATLTLAPSTLAPVDIPAEPDASGVRILATATDELRESDVAERLAAAASDAVSSPATERGEALPVLEEVVRYVDADSPGAIVVLVLERELRSNAGSGSVRLPVAGFTGYGERGKPAEDVAADATDGLAAFLDGSAAVDRHLADQLVVPLAIAGGSVRIPELTDHVATSLALLDGFGLRVDREERGDEVVLRADGASL